MDLYSDEQIPSLPLSEEYDLLINNLKEKCLISSKEGKIKIISLLPTSWSRQKISKEFQVSEHLIRITRAPQQLLKKQLNTIIMITKVCVQMSKHTRCEIRGLHPSL
jgi:hypothetical protein